MATPHVSALAGLISAQGYSAGQVRNRMETTATDLGPRGKDVGFGFGRVNYYKAAYRGYKQVVDNASSRFSASDGWGTTSFDNQKAGPNYRFTRPATRSGTAKFRMKVPSTTEYAVYAYWPADSSFNRRTRYYILTTSGFKVKVVDQRRNGGKFNLLGTYRLPYGDKNYIQVAGRSGVGGFIVADAVLIRRK
jgi:subtilisin family serine protease